MSNFSIGLALSGGAARGITHIGVLQALEEMGVPPNYITGVSSGAIVGALYGAGYRPKEILNIVKKLGFNRIFRFGWHGSGLLQMNKLVPLFETYLGDYQFEDLDLPFWAGAVDLHAGQTKFFHKGPLIKPILASCAIPLLFAPVEIDDKKYVDGGVLDNLPIEPIQDKADFIIGVNVNPVKTLENIGSYWGILERTFHLIIRSNIIHRKDECDWFIEPSVLGKYGAASINKADELFDIGYQYVKQHLPDRLKQITK